MTLHAAKGLEFDNVFIVGVEEGLLPHERSVDNGDETEEERRLFFVGITRAKVNLFIAFARYRQIRGQTLRTIPSQFLYELGISFSESAEQNDTSYFKSPTNHRQSQISNLQSEILPDEAVRNPKSPFNPGDKVVHKKFGIGTVKDFADMGDNSVITIAFSSGQTKTLMLQYAKLMKL
jgi:DNA helicase II / ATP-dependent DNA helicase PcrA